MPAAAEVLSAAIETLGRLPLNITVDPFSRSGGEIAFDVSHLTRSSIISLRSDHRYDVWRLLFLSPDRPGTIVPSRRIHRIMPLISFELRPDSLRCSEKISLQKAR